VYAANDSRPWQTTVTTAVITLTLHLGRIIGSGFIDRSMVHTTASSGLKSFTPLGIIKNVTSIHFGFLARGLFYDASLKVPWGRRTANLDDHNPRPVNINLWKS